MIYDNILGTIGNTPIVRIQRLAPKHVTMYVKCEFFNPLSSVKDRLAIAHHRGRRAHAARSSRARPSSRPPPATPASRWRWSARPRAIRSSPSWPSRSRSSAARSCACSGAKVILTPAAERGTGMVSKAAELAREARLVPRAPVRERGQSGLSPQHHRAGDPAGLRRQAARLLRHRLGHGRHADRRRPDDPARAPGRADHRDRAGGRRAALAASPSRRTRSRAGRRTSCPQCSIGKSPIAS